MFFSGEHWIGWMICIGFFSVVVVVVTIVVLPQWFSSIYSFIFFLLCNSWVFLFPWSSLMVIPMKKKLSTISTKFVVMFFFQFLLFIVAFINGHYIISFRYDSSWWYFFRDECWKYSCFYQRIFSMELGKKIIKIIECNNFENLNTIIGSWLIRLFSFSNI